MNSCLGIDTSNYTTSVALFDPESRSITQKKLLLPVRDGERGLRQSDALFHHTCRLPGLLEEILSDREISAVGVSTRPRNLEGSYMPCFLAGESAARAISAAIGAPLFRTSHQVGHILAALYSCESLGLVLSGRQFIAFHVSGGTTDCLLATPDSNEIIKCRELSTSLDLKAGQAVDRVGVMLGLSFPCGAELEKLALESTAKFRIKPVIRPGGCCLSGVENICKRMLENGEKPCDIALYCLKYIEAAVIAMTEDALAKYPGLPVVFAGGVMSDCIIRESLSKRFDSMFAEPALSSDNACGIAVFAAIKDGLLK